LEHRRPLPRSESGEGSDRHFKIHNPRSVRRMVEVKLGENDRLDWALKQFRRKMIRSGLFKDMKRRRFYEKPSVAKRRKAAAAKRRKARSLRRAR